MFLDSKRTCFSELNLRVNQAAVLYSDGCAEKYLQILRLLETVFPDS